MRLIAKSILVTLILLSLNGCASINAKTPPPPECAWVKPLSWHEDDTRQTVLEVFAHNLKYERFCQTGN